MTSLYDEDFYTWTQHQAALLREGQLQHLDVLHIAEELESAGNHAKRELSRRLRRLVTHLLKWRYHPPRSQVGRGWRSAIRAQRQEIAAMLEQSPSLRRTVPEALRVRYRSACKNASIYTRLPLETFPETCPWTAEQVLDNDFWPEG